MYLNKAFLYGNLTRDPELKSLPSGTKVATFGVATNRVYKDNEGNKKEQVDFHNLVVFGRQAEVVAQYLKKGRPVFVEGRIQTRSWDDQGSGQKKYRTEIVVDRFQFGPGGPPTAASSASNSANSSNAKDEQPAPPEDAIQYPDEEIKAEDIPF
ncbi:MAG: single-stranded DNA-binding protein [bacterium]|nr:single-stranded DNA-binding protein [bacterium]